MNAGNTFFAPLPPHNAAHLWIILSDPTADSNEVVIVPFMTIDDKKHTQDLTVQLGAGDHKFLKHPTFVNYSCAKSPALAEILRVKTGDHDPINPELLLKMREGAQKSMQCKQKYVRILEDQGLIEPEN